MIEGLRRNVRISDSKIMHLHTERGARGRSPRCVRILDDFRKNVESQSSAITI